MDFYETAKEAILSSSVKEKEALIKSLFETIPKEKNSGKIISFEKPSYSQICQIVPPQELPKRKRFDTKEGLGALLHSIAHIEYSAIDLALDAMYRFRDTPLEFKRDWLEVADDEVKHFLMIEKILNSLGFSYGDFPVHQGLFLAQKRTQNSLLERMAVIPRYYEATGLDVNPKIIQKLKSVQKITPEIEYTIRALEIIYQEEITHVQKGDKWFKWECERLNLNPYESFFEILENYGLLKRSFSINVKARLQAGFECKELKKFGIKKC